MSSVSQPCRSSLARVGRNSKQAWLRGRLSKTKPAKTDQELDAKLLLTVALNRNDGFELVTMDVHGKNEQSVRREPKGIAEPTWSPDCKRIAFVLFGSGVGQVFSMNADGSDLKNLTNSTDHERSPAWVATE